MSLVRLNSSSADKLAQWTSAAPSPSAIVERRFCFRCCAALERFGCCFTLLILWFQLKCPNSLDYSRVFLPHTPNIKLIYRTMQIVNVFHIVCVSVCVSFSFTPSLESLFFVACHFHELKHSRSHCTQRHSFQIDATCMLVVCTGRSKCGCGREWIRKDDKECDGGWGRGRRGHNIEIYQSGYIYRGLSLYFFTFGLSGYLAIHTTYPNILIHANIHNTSDPAIHKLLYVYIICIKILLCF